MNLLRILCRRPSVFPSALETRQAIYTLAFGSVVVLLPVTYAQAQRTCPTPNGALNPPNPSLAMAEGVPGRRAVDGDYLVVEYDALQHTTNWFDYHHNYDAHGIGRNGSFLPVVYSREKIAVHVCNLHFTDQLTVTTSPFAVPEGGADIRGSSALTALPTLSSTLDTPQTSVPSGVTVPQSSVGFGTTATATLTTVPGVVPGSIAMSSGIANYTDAQITVSGAQLAELLYGLNQNAKNLKHSLELTQSLSGLPGSIDSINKTLEAISAKVDFDTRDLKRYFHTTIPISLNDQAASAAAANFAAFDEDVTSVQGLAAELTTLSNALSAEGYGARAVTLRNNFAALQGVLDFIQLGVKAKNNCPTPDAIQVGSRAPNLTTDQIARLERQTLERMTPEEYRNFSTAQVQALTGPQLTVLRRDQMNALLEPRVPPSLPKTDQPYCGDFENQKFQTFNDSYGIELSLLLKSSSPDKAYSDKYAENTLALIQEDFKLLNQLRDTDLTKIDADTGVLFDKINEWYNVSAVEQTDLITPVSTNALMRISIVVQRGYTPFTLTNNPSAAGSSNSSTTTPTTTAASVSTTATTSTPAHSVKTVLVEVHRLANFNLAGGVMAIHVPTNSYFVTPSTAAATAVNPAPNPPTYTETCGSTQVTANGVPTTINGTTTYAAPTYSCITQTQKTNWQVAGMAGITWYLKGRDYFPRHTGFSNYKRNYLPGILIASSITSFGSGFGGLSFEPISGVDFFSGIASANRNVLPSGLSPNSIVASTYTLPSVTQVRVGFSAGIAFDFGVFTQLFSKTVNPVGGLP